MTPHNNTSFNPLASKRKAITTLLLEDFSNCWNYFFRDKLNSEANTANKHPGATLSNSADHPIAVIAVVYALSHSKIPQPVTTICYRGKDTWLMQDGIEYTTLHTTGPVGARFGTDPTLSDFAPYHSYNIEQACHEYMPCDSQGAYLMKMFLNRLGLELPEELQHCIDKADEYETPEVKQTLHDKIMRGINAELPVLDLLRNAFPESFTITASTIGELPVAKYPTDIEPGFQAPEVNTTPTIAVTAHAPDGLVGVGVIEPVNAEDPLKDPSLASLDPGVSELDWNTQANLDEPNLRDVEVSIDGMNVFDFYITSGSSVWVPRLKFVVSGDRGWDENGNRYVYAEVANALESLFELTDGTDIDQVNLLPHANVSRDDFEAETASAVGIIKYIIDYLREHHHDCRITSDYIHISVKTVDFDLCERAEAAWK